MVGLSAQRAPFQPARLRPEVVLTVLLVLLIAVIPRSVPEPVAIELHRATSLSTSFSPLPVSLLLTGQPGVVTLGGQRFASALRFGDGTRYAFPTDFRAADVTTARTNSLVDSILGPAQSLAATFQTADGASRTSLRITAATQSAAAIYQLVWAGPAAPTEIMLLQGSLGAFNLYGSVSYLTVLSPGPVVGMAVPGGVPTELIVAPGSPVLLWSERDRRGYLLALLDDTEEFGTVTLAADSLRGLSITLTTGPAGNLPVASPRLYVERLDTPNLSQSLTRYRSALDVLAPAPEAPGNFRNQWGSWYVFGGGVTEDLLRAQIDAIVTTYADLGPWQVEIDAGWYRAGEDPEGQIGEVDTEKFPSGMRALVDYAHARGISVILYGSAPWVDSRPSTSSWWVVQQRLVREHPDWLIEVDRDADGATYVYDLSQSDVRAFLGGLVRRYLVDFDADGIELDMVGIVGPTGACTGVPLLLPERPAARLLSNKRWTSTDRCGPRRTG